MNASRFILAAALVLPLFPHVAQAASGEWTTVASACMPDENAIASYSNDSAASFIVSGITGDIVLRCNVTNPSDIVNAGMPDWNMMDVTFNDQDGPGIDKAVLVSLRRVHESSGASSTIASFNSNDHAAGQQRNSKFYTHVFDFEYYAYYLQITLRRVSLDADSNGVADPSPRIQRVRLYTVVPG